MKKLIIALFIMFGTFAIYGGIASLCYSAIAWEFNLPQLNYWVITGVFFLLNALRKGISIDINKED